MNKVAVVVLNYKVKQLALECIKSVKQSSIKDIKIYLVDNNSQDGIEKEISGDIEFIQTGDNLGFSGGNNVGIKKALKDGVEFIFILNPDTKIDKKTIETLIAVMEKNSASIASPKIYYGDTNKIWFAGGIFDKANVLGSNRGVNEDDNGQYDEDIEVDLVTGAAMMIKSEVFKKIGLFDEKYFLYYEDSDFCYRAKKAGFKIMYVGTAKIIHNNAQSTGLGSSLQDYFITRNRMLYAAKFLGIRTQFALFREALRNIKNPARKKALFDFWLGNFGKGSFIK